MNRFLVATLPVLLVPVIPLALATSCMNGGVPGASGSGTGATGGSVGQISQPRSGGATATTVDTGGGAGPSGGPQVASTAGTGNGGGLPCDVATVLKAKCQLCHGATPQYGATMSLVTYADTQAPARSQPSSKVWEMMRTRIHATTTSAPTPMPPNGQPALTTGTGGELAVLDAWFAAGAPSSTVACGTGGGGGVSTGTGGTPGGTGGGPSGAAGQTGGEATATGVGPQFLPCTPSHIITAHAPGSTTTKYPVPDPTNDAYVCFNFKSPFAAGEQATAFAPIIDDSRVIHHWILFGSTTSVGDGAIQANCVAPSATAVHVTGWAPGGQNAVLDPDVGLKLDYPYFQLQVHYNNQRYADGADASGVAICSTTMPRTNEAGIVTLGPGFFSIPAKASDYPVSASCTGGLATDGKTPITIIGTSPHMHLLGTGFTTTHMRGGTDMGDLSNIPLGSWSFDNQKHYAITPRRQVLPSDTLKTTCFYDNPTSSPVSFGTRTTDEMCFDFITVYPYAAAKKGCRM